MVKFDTEQRKLLADKLCDCGNLAAGALLFGQFLADRLSIVLVGLGLTVWGHLDRFRPQVDKGGQTMTGAYILLGGILVFAIVIMIIDEMGRRQERAERK